MAHQAHQFRGFSFACCRDQNCPKGPKIEEIKSRLKFKISIEIFNLELQNSPQKKGFGGRLV